MEEAKDYLFDILSEWYGEEYVTGGIAVGGFNMQTLNRLLEYKTGYHNLVQINDSENLDLDLDGLEEYLKMDHSF